MSKEAIHTANPQKQPAAIANAFTQKNGLKENSEQEPEKNSYINVQPKLSVGAPNDPYEKEADAVADRVMRMPEQSFVQRKCAECEKEEKLSRKPLSENITPFIQAKNESNTPPISNSTTQSIQSSRGSGSAMDERTSSFMSSRFGADFNNVKIHSNSKSIQLSKELNAKAFTVGSDIYFNEGQYQPASSAGKTLLAHELTHVVQQNNSASTSTVQKDEFEPWEGQQGEIVKDSRTTKGTTSSVLVNRTDDPSLAANNPIKLTFDTTACKVTLHKQLIFVRHSDEEYTLPEDEFKSLKNRILKIANEYFDGWYAVVAEDENCPYCKNKKIDIDVEATDGTDEYVKADAADDYDSLEKSREKIDLLKGTGRSSDHAIYSKGALFDPFFGDVTSGTLAHELGHLLLNLPDEYGWTKSMVSDSSLMAYAMYRLSVLHKRHIDFVTNILNQMYPGCKFSLVELKRPMMLEYKPELGLASYSMGDRGKGAAGLKLGLSIGVPLTRDRSWQLYLGPQFNIISDGHDNAYFIGGEAKLSHVIGLFGLPFQLSAFAGGGVNIGSLADLKVDKYYEAGGSLSVSLKGLSFGLDVSKGMLEDEFGQSGKYQKTSFTVGRSF